ncbi:uncharacterized protein LOC135684610 [Rhopilema esculentum]|uniref:uncharacterized protein LOC135684610 n=1 Tax=Rhopilema esculentum TaxID=499914 RepID=UPI0031D2FA28
MSLSTRINGFTAWMNLRLSHSTGHLMENVLVDLLKGYNMKMLLESLTGKPFKKIRSFDGLSLVQKETRVEWMVQELKHHEIIPQNFKIDARMFAMKDTDQVFNLLWSLVCNDIWFVWERSDFLQQKDENTLLSKQFTWAPPVTQQNTQAYEVDKSLLSGFGSRSVVLKPTTEEEKKPCKKKWSLKQAVEERDAEMINRKKIKPNDYPDPDYCILDLINVHLKMTKDGSKLKRGVLSLDDLSDSRVLSALVNSFVPETFTTEVLLNDRWTVNLVLWTIAKMFKCSNPFVAEDLVEGDVMSECAYFAFFFMCGYRFKQSSAVVDKMEKLKSKNTAVSDELQKLQANLTTSANLKRKTELEKSLEDIESETRELEQTFNVPECYSWVKHVFDVRIEIRSIVAQKIKERYEVVIVPSNLTINELVTSMMINLSITGGTGFYNVSGKESITKDRKIIVKDIETGEYFDDLKTDDKNKVSAREVLGIKKHDVFDLQPSSFPQYEIYLDCGSKNKALKKGTKFLYQVFPGNSMQCQRLLYKAAKNGELESVQKLVAFFEKSHNFVNSRDKKSGNTAMHVACRNGQLEIVEFLLESGADVDCLNIFGVTPFFLALEGLHKRVGQLLIEWGANIEKKNRSGKTALELLRNSELKEFYKGRSNELTTKVPLIIGGDNSTLLHVLKEHHLGIKKFASLRSRCLNGSTFLHTAAYFGNIGAVKILLAERVDVNLLDYRGATPLHRVKDAMTMELLLESGADINVLDEDKNSPLHVKCYGEHGEPTQLECINKLIEKRISLVTRNRRELMPIHCCAMQGRIDGIQALLAADSDGAIRLALEDETELPPSLVHLAIANDHLDTACWLLGNSFDFKDSEPDLLLEKLLMDKIPCSNFTATIELLLSSGASTCIFYSQGNTPLHLAASQRHMTDVLELLINRGSDVNALNEDRHTPLFYAARTNNLNGAKILLENGADFRVRNYQGQTAFDLIPDYDEWIESQYFLGDILARLKAYSLKQARDLVRVISKKIQNAERLPDAGLSSNRMIMKTNRLPALLPPIKK